MYYLIDGYNLFFHLQDDPTNLNRKEFVQYISSLMKEKKFVGEMIFDTALHHQSSLPHTREAPPLIISFAAENLEADDLIVEKLYAHKKPEKVIVVTSDRELIRRVKDLEGKAISSDNFLKKLHKNKRKQTLSKKPLYQPVKEKERLQKIFEEKLKDTNE